MLLRYGVKRRLLRQKVGKKRCAHNEKGWWLSFLVFKGIEKRRRKGEVGF